MSKDIELKVSSEGLQPDLETFFDSVMAEVELRIKMRTPVRGGALQRSIGVVKLGDGYGITSDKDYFLFVENGTSKMEPVGMVRTTLEELEVIIQQKLPELKYKN